MPSPTVDRVSTKVEDCLDNDPPIRGQNYVCLSFISPEDVIVKKDLYFFNKFLGLFSKDVKELFDVMVDKYKDQPEMQDMFINLQSRYDYLFSPEKLKEEFDFYKASNSEELEKDYLEKNAFQTTMRGIKVRGVFETIGEAQKRAQKLKETDGKFDVYVAEVGCWCPWSPNPDEIQDQEFAETELNTMVKKYKENLSMRAQFHNQRAEELKSKAHKQRDVEAAGEVSVKLVEVPAPPTLDGEDPWLTAKGAAKENVAEK